MYKHFLYGLIIFFFSVLFTTNKALAQQQFQIRNIILEGNDKTKPKVIHRELNFYKGDTINTLELEEIFTRNRLQLLSTGLFNDVQFNLKAYDLEKKTADIHITLEENWYLYPVPIFELADRNFNVWWKEQGRALDRTNYGFRVGHYNFSGNRDRLKLKIHFGYVRKYELEYSYPYLAMDNKLGIAASIFYSENREIAYQTVANKTLFHKMDDERKLLSRFRIGPELKYRPDIYNNHSLRLEYHQNQIDDFVAEELNPDYFLNGETQLRFVYLQYSYSFDKRQYAQYPLGGHLIFGNIKKEGVGLFNDFDNLGVTLGFEKHHSLTNKLILGSRNIGKTNLNRNQVAFANNTGIGWNSDIVSGYDLYVLDGTDYFISMNNVKLKFFDSNLNTVKWMPKQFRKMNMTMFIRANFDTAYVNEPTYKNTNTLNNKWIYGFGPAIDMILFNNFLFSFEYSFNDRGESGLFFYNSIAF